MSDGINVRIYVLEPDSPWFLSEKVTESSVNGRPRYTTSIDRQPCYVERAK
jgi:hypothetical protein